jgi:hypothetical protein
MNGHRKRFFAALGLFLAWLIVLGLLASMSARIPRAAPDTHVDRAA